MKKLLSALAAGLIALSAFGCGGKEPAKIINFQQPDSLCFDAALHLTVEAGEQKLPFRASIRGETTAQPKVVHGRIRAGLQNAAAELEIYTEASGDQILIYTGLPMGGRTLWKKFREDMPEISLLDGAALLGILGTTRSDGQGRTIDGRTGELHRGELTARELQKLLKALMLLKGIRGEKAKELESLLDRMDPNAGLPFECVLDPDQGHLMELRLDMRDALLKALRRHGVSHSSKVEEFTFRLTLSDHDQVEPILIPAEARTAS